MANSSYVLIEYVGGMKCSGCQKFVMLDPSWKCPVCGKNLFDEF